MIGTTRFGAVAIVLTLLGATWLPVPAAPSECEAQIDSELTRQEEGESGTHYTWKVNVETEEDCATIEFELILTIQKPEGEDQTVVRLGRVRLSDGSIEHLMRYEMKPDDNLVKWEVVMSSCEPCVLDAPD